MASDGSEGFDSLDKALALMPKLMAVNLQRVIRANHRDHLKEVDRSSTGFTPEGKRRVIRSFHIKPEAKVKPKSIKAVFGDTATFWRGDSDTPVRDGTARLLEKSIVESETLPERTKYLAIPLGALRNPSGGVRRRNRKRIKVADQKNTHLVGTRRGSLLVIQRRGRGASRGRRAFIEGQKKQFRGQSERLVGVLVKRAARRNNIDFFQAWERLRSKRRDRYRRFLDDVVSKDFVRR